MIDREQQFLLQAEENARLQAAYAAEVERIADEISYVLNNVNLIVVSENDSIALLAQLLNFVNKLLSMTVDFVCR